VKKHESQVGEHDKLKLKVIVLHDSIGKEVHMINQFGSLLKICSSSVSSVKLVWMNYVWLDPVEHGYIGNNNGASNWSRHGAMSCSTQI